MTFVGSCQSKCWAVVYVTDKSLGIFQLLSRFPLSKTQLLELEERDSLIRTHLLSGAQLTPTDYSHSRTDIRSVSSCLQYFALFALLVYKVQNRVCSFLPLAPWLY